MATTETLTPDQLSTAVVVANPYPAYRQFRDQTPLQLCRYTGGQGSRHRGIDPRVGADEV